MIAKDRIQFLIFPSHLSSDIRHLYKNSLYYMFVTLHETHRRTSFQCHLELTSHNSHGPNPLEGDPAGPKFMTQTHREENSMKLQFMISTQVIVAIHK